MGLFVPSDNDEMRDKSGSNGGTCGPSVLAAYGEMRVKDVLENWCGVGYSRWRGFSPIDDMKATMKALGWSFRYVRAHKSKTFPLPVTNAAILRIQWLNEDGLEYYWRAAGSHTHYVLMLRHCGDWWIFCNAEGWFSRDSPKGENYLKGRGFVSSYLEILKPEWQAKMKP